MATRKLAALYLERYASESAKILEHLPGPEVAKVLMNIPTKSCAAVLARVAPRVASVCFEAFPPDRQQLILEELPPSLAAVIMRLLPTDIREAVWRKLPDHVKIPIDRALGFPPNSAGSVADPGVPTLYDDTQVQQAIEYLCTAGSEHSTTVFVLDRTQRVIGAVTSDKLLCARREATIGSLELDSVRTAWTFLPVSLLVDSDRYGAGPVAVVDSSGIFVGVVGQDVLSAETQLRRKTKQPAAHLAAGIAELYWVGLRDIWGGLGPPPRLAAMPERNVE